MNTAAEVVLNWHRALGTGEVEQVIDFSDPQIELIGPRGSAFGHGVLREWLVGAGLKLEVTQLYVRQNVVVAAERAVWRSAETGEVVGQAEVATVFRIRGRQVASLARHDTLKEALAQAGITTDDLFLT